MVRDELIDSKEVRTGAHPLWTFMEWLLGILGGIAAFLGAFILLADDGQYVGIGGDLSWRVGDISATWAYGLLIGGIALLLITLAMIVGARRSPGMARASGSGLTNLLWHAGIFVVVNAFIWLQDIALGDGLGYAYWITIPWGVGLAIHALTYLFGIGGVTPGVEAEERATGETIEQETRPLQPH